MNHNLTANDQHAIKRKEGQIRSTIEYMVRYILMFIVRAITEITRTDQRAQRPEYAKPPKLPCYS
jgi:hypothetical protein